MRRISYGFTVSLDGFIAGRNDDIGWSAPDEELHEFYNEQARQSDLYLYGRRLYQLMQEFWPTADQDPDAPPHVVDYARLWQATPKVVFSSTLTEVAGNARLATGDAVAEVRRLKEEPGGDIQVGGAGLAASLMQHGLIDEYHYVVAPVVVGGGTPFFPALTDRIPLRLVQTRTFGSGVVYLRYATMNE
ncbi:MAG TPA: dihydrofolate reductase family protein [Actinophytocola sp.]|uniref:dihydrofolate reductase family protein n=1 Tax=Actinophytocola sp. TaxID=1872138 RepID=UPI002DBFC0D2|nr:dihydrofolate reductase family protein [Actinophytocola sp.]HEU5474410.1 dihydrofolate reductase family protein [Actinophytocola sp.]